MMAAQLALIPLISRVITDVALSFMFQNSLKARMIAIAAMVKVAIMAIRSESIAFRFICGSYLKDLFRFSKRVSLLSSLPA
jgi:hypothetical protein